MTDWSRLVKASLVGVDPYDPGPSLAELRERFGLDEIVRLNWNEGLFGPAPGVLEAAAAELEHAWRYPEQAYADLRDAVSAHAGVPPDHIVPAHGIQALVGVLASAFVTPGARAVVPVPTYGLYAQVWSGAGAIVERVPVRHNLGLDLDALAGAAQRTGARLALVVDPNNPTGAHVAADEWRTFLGALPDGCVAVVDEAYGDYVDPAVRIPREQDVLEGRPVVVLRTFSKLFGLAGLRLGYAIAAPELARYLDVVQEPFNVNRAALAAGRASLSVPRLVETRRAETVEGREALVRLLAAAGAEPIASQANFVLVRTGVDDVALTEWLLRRGLLVRAGSEFGLPGTVRITVGAVPLMERVARELAEACSSLPAFPEAGR
jgi:histidinol-phosphate aminotransferase